MSYIYYTGGHVLHSYGRIIPQFYPITDLRQISGPDGIGRINCTVSNGTAKFSTLQPSGLLEAGEVPFIGNGTTATLVVKSTSQFENREMYCRSRFYLYISVNGEFTLTVDQCTTCMRAGRPGTYTIPEDDSKTNCNTLCICI